MKLKKILALGIIIGVIMTLLIYYFFHDRKYDIIALGDGLAYGETIYNIKGYSFNDYLKDHYQKQNFLKSYNADYCIKNITSKEMLDLILNNKKINNNLTINQLINKAEIITISLGTDELYNNSNINTYIYNINQIIAEICKINHKKIYLIGVFGNSNKIKDINYWLNNIANKNKIVFINIMELNDRKYLFKEDSKYLNYQGQEKIYKKIIANT